MGPKADLRQPMFDVRLSFDSGHRKTAAARPLCANNGYHTWPDIAECERQIGGEFGDNAGPIRPKTGRSEVMVNRIS
jgi:hypothetical protein